MHVNRAFDLRRTSLPNSTKRPRTGALSTMIRAIFANWPALRSIALLAVLAGACLSDAKLTLKKEELPQAYPVSLPLGSPLRRSTSRSGQLRRSPRSRRRREGAQGPDREVEVAGARPGSASGVQNLYGKSNLRHFAVLLLRFCCVVPKFVPYFLLRLPPCGRGSPHNTPSFSRE